MKKFLLSLIAFASFFSHRNALADSATDALIVSRAHSLVKYPHDRAIFDGLASDTERSIKEVALVLCLWNHNLNCTDAKKMLTTRVQVMGVEKGLAEPSLVMMDMAMLAHEPQISEMLIPTIRQSYSPEFVSQIEAKAGIHGVSQAEWKSAYLATREAIGRNTNNGAFSSDRAIGMKIIGSRFRQIDSSGFTDALLGPGAMIRKSMGANAAGFNPNERGPIFGLSRDDISACMSSCRQPMQHGYKIGEASGTKVGSVAGLIVGSAYGSPGAGATIGTLVGPYAGAGVGTIIAGVSCAAGCSAPDSEDHQPTQRTVAPVTLSNPAPAPAPAPAPHQSSEAPTPPSHTETPSSAPRVTDAPNANPNPSACIGAGCIALAANPEIEIDRGGNDDSNGNGNIDIYSLKLDKKMTPEFSIDAFVNPALSPSLTQLQDAVDVATGRR